MLVGLVAVVMVFGIPLSAILGSVWLKGKRVDAESGGGDLRRRLAQLEADNPDLRERVEVLETIATADSPAEARVRVAALHGAAQETADLDVSPRGAAARSQRM